MLKPLTTLSYLGLLFIGCDGSGVDPVQQSTGGLPANGGAGNVPASSSGGSTRQSTGGTTSALGGQSNTSGGSSDAGSSAANAGKCLITPTPDAGWVDGTTNDCRIQGAWFSYNDCKTSPSDCTTNQVPAVGGTGFPLANGKVCTSGSTAAINGATTTKWGAGIGLNLNQPGGNDVKNPISALPRTLLGFNFTLSGAVVPGTIHVIFPTTETPETGHFVAIAAKAGDYTVRFAEAKQSEWVTTKIDLVQGNIFAVQFQVPADNVVALPFDFCVEKLTALY